MFIRACHSILFLLLLAAELTYADDVTRTCKWPILNALNRLEIKGSSSLEINEYKIDYRPLISEDLIIDQSLMLTKKIKKIVYAQNAIVKNSIVLSGLKFIAVTIAKKDAIQKMNGEYLTLIDPQGKEVQYQFRRMQTLVKEETYFDTEDLKLHQNNNQLRTSTTFQLSNEKNIQKKTTLNETDQAVKSARQSGIGNAVLIPVVNKRIETFQLGLYPVIVPKNKKAEPSFIMSLDTITSSGQGNRLNGKENIEYFTSIEDLGTGDKTREIELEQLTKKMQSRFGLTRAPATEKSGVDLVSGDEERIGQ